MNLLHKVGTKTYRKLQNCDCHSSWNDRTYCYLLSDSVSPYSSWSSKTDRQTDRHCDTKCRVSSSCVVSAVLD